MNYSCLIIDDEIMAISSLREEIEKGCPELKIIGSAGNIKDTINLINTLSPDLVFLDLRLEDGIGFEILEAIKKPVPRIIFTTAYSEYALKAIKFNALDYLLKPIESIELRLAVSKFIQQDAKSVQPRYQNLIDNLNQPNGEKRIVLQSSSGIQMTPLKEIVRIQANGNYSEIHFAASRRIIISKTLKDFEEMLSDLGFERVHLSHLINLDHLNYYHNKDGGYLEMSDKSTVPLAQRKKSAFLKLLNQINLK